MIISAVQLGATVDYAILYAGRYLEKRKIYEKRSGTASGFRDIRLDFDFRHDPYDGRNRNLFDIKRCNHRSARTADRPRPQFFLSAVMVMIFLPNLMVLCDRIIAKTTKNSGFTEV
jgi:hypothetical protein